MLSEFKNSLSSILNERITKPLYGAFIISWLIWNWEIIYLTLFIDQDKLPINKLDFIKKNYYLEHKLFWWPILSTIIILTVLPFISNGASWLSFKFNRWLLKKKNEVEDKRLLSNEEGLALKTESRQMRISFAEMINEKDKKISELQSELQNEILALTKEKDQQIEELTKELEKLNSVNPKPESILKTDIYFQNILHDINNLIILKSIFKAAIDGMSINDNLRKSDIMDYLLTGGYIYNTDYLNSLFAPTDKGNQLYNEILRNEVK